MSKKYSDALYIDAPLAIWQPPQLCTLFFDFCLTVKPYEFYCFKESGMMNQGTEILSPATYLRKASWLFEESKNTKWTAEENKRFENALALFDKDTPDRWYKVAAILPGKTVNDVIKKYNELIEDVSDIEAGLIPIPGDTSSSFTLEQVNDQGYSGPEQFFGPGGKRRLSARSSDPVRKKGVPWTEEEHRQFLLGLQKYGKGDWRNISRNFVTTRTPTQVASHAQKYFIRQLSGGKDKRRSSIHDITTAGVTETKSPSPEEQRPPRSLDKSATVMQLQHHSNMNSITNALYNHNLQNHGPEKAIEMQNNCLDKTHLHGTPLFDERLHEHNLQNINSHGLQLGRYNMFHHLQSTQRQ